MTRKPIFHKCGSQIPVSLNKVTPDFYLLCLPTAVVVLLYSSPLHPSNPPYVLAWPAGRWDKAARGLAGHQSAVVSNCFVLHLFCVCTLTYTIYNHHRYYYFSLFCFSKQFCILFLSLPVSSPFLPPVLFPPSHREQGERAVWVLSCPQD